LGYLKVFAVIKAKPKKTLAAHLKPGAMLSFHSINLDHHSINLDQSQGQCSVFTT